MTAVVDVQVVAISTGRWRSTEHSRGESVFALFFWFLPIQKLPGRTENYANALEEGMTVDVNSLRYLPRRSRAILRYFGQEW